MTQYTVYQRSKDFLTHNAIFLRQNYTQKIKDYSDSLNIIILEWQRRVWKSYAILWFLQQYNISLDTVFYLNKEFDIYDEIANKQDLNLLFETVNKNKSIEYIIIDEIQMILYREKFIISMYAQKKYKIIITGSNATLLSGEFATLLTGRYMTIHILPFSYNEFLLLKQSTNDKDSFIEYITYGGMPEVLLLSNNDLKNNYIKNTLNSIFLKDIVSRFTIRNIKLLEKILQFLQSEVWGIVSITNIHRYIAHIFKKEISLTTISNYLGYLTYPYLVNEVSRYDIKWKKILDYTGKYYFSDIGIRNSNGFIFSQDIGKILENLVYIKLIAQWYTVYIGDLSWKEIDFIAEKWWERVYIQVCYLLSSEAVIQREFWNLLSISDNYPKIVVSMDDTFWNTFQWIQSMYILDFLTKD